MSTFAFEVVVVGLTGDADQVDRLFSEQIRIVSGLIDGVGHLDVEIDAASSEEALHELDCHLRTRAPEISLFRVDEDLVTVSEIADRIGQNRETVRLWSTGRRRSDFPSHRAVLPGGTKLWPWGAVFPWLAAQGLVQNFDVVPLSPDSVDWFNGQLVTRRREPLVVGEPFPTGWRASGVANIEFATFVELPPHKSRQFKSKAAGPVQIFWDFAGA